MQTQPYHPESCRHGTDLVSAIVAMRLTPCVHCVHVLARLAYNLVVGAGPPDVVVEVVVVDYLQEGPHRDLNPRNQTY